MPRIKSKANGTARNDRFFIERRRWIRALSMTTTLTSAAKFVGIVLVHFANFERFTQIGAFYVYPSQEMLAANCGCEVSSVKRALKQLEAEGVIVKTRQGGLGGIDKRNEYRFDIDWINARDKKLARRLPLWPDNKDLPLPHQGTSYPVGSAPVQNPPGKKRPNHQGKSEKSTRAETPYKSTEHKTQSKNTEGGPARKGKAGRVVGEGKGKPSMTLADYEPGPDIAAWALNACPAVSNPSDAAIVGRFRDWHLAKGITRKNWDAAYRNWLRKENDFAVERLAEKTRVSASGRGGTAADKLREAGIKIAEEAHR